MVNITVFILLKQLISGYKVFHNAGAQLVNKRYSIYNTQVIQSMITNYQPEYDNISKII